MTLTLLEQEMLEALKWYEARVCDCRKNTSDGDRARHELDRDGGKRASAVIKKARGVDGAALNLAEEALLLFEELKEDEK